MGVAFVAVTVMVIPHTAASNYFSVSSGVGGPEHLHTGIHTVLYKIHLFLFYVTLR